MIRICLCVMSALCMHIFNGRVQGHIPDSHPDECVYCPFFTNTTSLVHTSVGIPVNLSCGVRNLGDSQVSWIRRRDLHVLTTTTMTYTSDSRFRAAHVQGSPFWILEISNPSVSDAGVYECQISSQPKIHKRFTLLVSVPVARIIGSTEIYMKSGSDINITCIITGHIEPVNILWYHNPPQNEKDQVVEINAGERGGVQLVTDRKAGTSWLLVNKATWRDAGNYTCAPAHTSPAHVSVHIIQAEEAPAAMTPELANAGTSLHYWFRCTSHHTCRSTSFKEWGTASKIFWKQIQSILHLLHGSHEDIILNEEQQSAQWVMAQDKCMELVSSIPVHLWTVIFFGIHLNQWQCESSLNLIYLYVIFYLYSFRLLEHFPGALLPSCVLIFVNILTEKTTKNKVLFKNQSNSIITDNNLHWVTTSGVSGTVTRT